MAIIISINKRSLIKQLNPNLKLIKSINKISLIYTYLKTLINCDSLSIYKRNS